MTVHTICDTCGMEYEWAGVTVDNNIYCCLGCANGGPCTCVQSAQPTVVVAGQNVVVANDRVVIVE